MTANPTKEGAVSTAPEAPPVFATADGEVVTAFTDTITKFRRGELDRSLSLDLHQLIQDVISVEKPGTLTLTVKVEPVGDMQVQVICKTAAKTPEPTPPAALYFVGRDGRLTRHDPYQGSMFQEADPDE
jgi:hypothetical protein